METELLTIYNADMQYLGSRTRAEVHAQGFWHETFHCWFVKEDTYLLFQRRSLQKKDYPGLLDITAAGHLLAGEHPLDGIREVNEELGITLNTANLQLIGIVKEENIRDTFINREFNHIYLYKCTTPIENFVLQNNEVAGIIQIDISAFEQFINGNSFTVRGTGYNIETNGVKSHIDTNFIQDDFSPHNKEYFLRILQNIKKMKTE